MMGCQTAGEKVAFNRLMVSEFFFFTVSLQLLSQEQDHLSQRINPPDILLLAHEVTTMFLHAPFSFLELLPKNTNGFRPSRFKKYRGTFKSVVFLMTMMDNGITGLA